MQQLHKIPYISYQIKINQELINISNSSFIVMLLNFHINLFIIQMTTLVCSSGSAQYICRPKVN